MSERRFTRLKASLAENAAKTRETVSRELRQSLNANQESFLDCIDCDYEKCVRQWNELCVPQSEQSIYKPFYVEQNDIECLSESKDCQFDFNRYYPLDKLTITSQFSKECIHHYVDCKHLLRYNSLKKYFGSVFDTFATTKCPSELGGLCSSKNFLSGFSLRPHIFECDEEEYDSGVYGPKMLIREGSASVIDDGDGDFINGWLTLSRDEHNCFLTFYNSSKRDKILWHVEVNQRVEKYEKENCFKVIKYVIYTDANYIDYWVNDINSNILAEFCPKSELYRIMIEDNEIISKHLKSYELINNINLFAAYNDLNHRKGNHSRLRDDIFICNSRQPPKQTNVNIFKFILSIKSSDVPHNDRNHANDTYFFRISLFDTKHGKISEEFRHVTYPDIRSLRTSTPAEQNRDYDQRLLCNASKALFTVDLNYSQSNDLYLVLRVERTSHRLSHFNCLPINYSSSTNNNNKVLNTGIVAQHVDPYAWSIRPLFHPDSLILEATRNFGLFYKMDQSKLSDEFISNIYSQCPSRSHTSITGKLDIEIVEFETYLSQQKLIDDGSQEIIFNSSLFAKQPINSMKPVSAILEIQSLHLIPQPYTEYFNILYIFPQSLKFDSQKVFSKARNLAVTVEIRDTDDINEAKPLKVIFGRPHDSSLFVTSATTAISKHNVTPDFFEEIKVALPLDFSEKLHILFTFSHISCKKECSYSVVGYSWFPISPEKRHIHCQNMLLSVFASLPDAYLSCQSLGLGKGLSMPDVKFVGKDLFKVSLVLTSSAISRDVELQNTLASVIKITKTKTQSDSKDISQIISLENTLPKMLRSLSQCDDDELIHFSQIIIQQLFKLLVFAASQKLIEETFDSILSLADKFTNQMNILNEFIEVTFETAQFSGVYIHDQLMILLLNRFNEFTTKTVSVDEIKIMLKNLWFILRIMAKSMLQYLFESGKIKLNREDRFDVDFTTNLKNFLESTSGLIATYSRLDEAQNANKALAHFLTRLASFFDRSVVFNAFYHHGNILSSRDVLIQELKLNSIAILLAHEHFVTYCNPLILKDTFTLTEDFSKQHFPVFMILSEFKNAFHHSATTVRQVRQTSLAALRNQLAKHLLDDRYTSIECREKVLSLYLPIIPVILENTNRMIDSTNKDSGYSFGFNTGKSTSPISTIHEQSLSDLSSLLVRSSSEIASNFNSISSYNSLSSTSTVASNTTLSHNRTNSVSTVRMDKFSSEEVSDLFICLLSVVQVLNMERMNMLSKKQLRDLFLSLECALNCFEYKPRKFTDNRAKSMPNSNTNNNSDNLTNYLLQQNLSIQSALITLRTIHLYLDNDQEPIDSSISQILSIYLTLMTLPQSQLVLINVFNSVRYFVHKFAMLLFNSDAFLSPIISKVIKYCNSSLTPIRQNATDLLYCLFTTNMKRTRFETIVCVSRLASSDPHGLLYLHSSLNRIEQLSNVDTEHAHSMVDDKNEQLDSEDEEVSVIHIVGRIREILKATKQIREESFDPYLASELRLQLANSYSRTSRSLLRTWMENLSEVHVKNKDWTEAAMCLCQVIAILIEQLSSKEVDIVDGMLNICKVSDNIFAKDSIKRESDWLELEESHVSIDVLETIITDCVELFEKAELYELAPHVLKVMISIHEKEFDHKKLAHLYTKIARMHSKAQELNDSGKRIFYTFFRVAFYYIGSGQKSEFIYIVPKVVSLAEMTTKMQTLYPNANFLSSDNCIPQNDSLEELKTSDQLNGFIGLNGNSSGETINKLCSNCSIVITHVTPYVENARNLFEKNIGVQRFVFEQRLNSKIAQSVAEQYKKRVILTAQNSFPYFLKRIPVICKQELILNPIEVAIDEMQERVYQLEHVINTQDAKHLQLVLQGSVNATVNCGPIAYANAFLNVPNPEIDTVDASIEGHFSESQKHLKFLFEQFLDLCESALKLNEKLIKPNQVEYHSNLKSNFEKLKSQLDIFNDRRTSIQIFDVISGSTFA